jgi:hypothetical protein
MSDVATLLVALAGEGSLNVIPSGVIAQAVDSLTALLKYAQVPRRLITDAVGQAVGAVEFAAMRACFERGHVVLTAAQSDWTALVDAGATMATDSESAAEAVAELRERLPAIAGELESRLAVAEDVAGRLGGGVEAVEAFQGQLDELVATVGGLSLPLEELADDAAGTALRTVLEPVASALETARATTIAPLQEVQQSAQSLRTLLITVARVAEETIGLYRDALERTVAAVSECDSVTEMVTALAEESAALGPREEDLAVDATLEDWRALGPEIAAAEAALEVGRAQAFLSPRGLARARDAS